MNPADVIESYVDEVIRRLPRRLRRDVGLELRALLGESLAARAEDAGRPADEAMALELLREFGSPAEAAQQYAPTGFDVVPPSQARVFTWLAIGGVALQWAASLPYVFGYGPTQGPDGVSRLSQWWLSAGLGAFWWPGFLVTITLVAGWIGRQRAPAPAKVWKPRVVDPDRINPRAWWASFVAAAFGASILVGLVFAGPHLPPPLDRVFAFDPGFLRTGALAVALMWSLQLALYAMALRQGRWTRHTRRLRLALSVLSCLVMAWLAWGGPIFTAPESDSVARGWIALLTLLIIVLTGAQIYREWMRLRPASALPSASGLRPG